jgi:pimeloyl-ACP methyl ester carboxylesterase
MAAAGLKEGYGMMVDAIIRPPRNTYDERELGPSRVRMGSRVFKRTDLVLENERGQKLQCSHYEPEERPRERLPCLCYLHGNCGNRLEAAEALRVVLPYNITLFCLDFSGCGNSEGDYISLGYFEKFDLVAAINHLQSTQTVSRIALWGRSMGAATSLLFAALKERPEISCMVVDSPFSSLTVVARELVENSGVNVPSMFVSMGLRMIRKSIRSKAGFDVEKLRPIKRAHKCTVPVLFAHGESDNFILPHHSRELLEKYGGEKNLIMVEGDHNSRRPRFFVDSVSIFLNNHLLVGDDAFDNDSYEAAMVDGGHIVPAGGGGGHYGMLGGASSSASAHMGGDPFGGGIPFGGGGGGGGGIDDDEAMLQQVIAMSMQEQQETEAAMAASVGGGGDDDDPDDEDAALAAAIAASKAEFEEMQQVQSALANADEQDDEQDKPIALD